MLTSSSCLLHPLSSSAVMSAGGSSPPLPSEAAKCPIDHSQLSKEAWEKLSNAHPHLHPPSSPPILSSSSSPTRTLPTPAPSTPTPLACDSTTFSAPPPTPPSSLHIVGDVFPDSTPSPSQRLPLSTVPVASSIPRSGVDPTTSLPHSTWVFPSPQRFYNAMAKKGWEPKERDMTAVVSIHNTVNEETWRRVRRWEEVLHGTECRDVKLARFKGRPNDASVKARVRGWMGYTAPFDRHDWYVDRCGKEVRYIIDFYEGTQEEGGGKAAAIHIDARPAVDSAGALFDRLRMQAKEWL